MNTEFSYVNIIYSKLMIFVTFILFGDLYNDISTYDNGTFVYELSNNIWIADNGHLLTTNETRQLSVSQAKKLTKLEYLPLTDPTLHRTIQRKVVLEWTRLQEIQLCAYLRVMIRDTPIFEYESSYLLF